MELAPRVQKLYSTKTVKRGLIIGKFMPIHKGHLALIEYSMRQCDELILSMSFTVNDPIDASLRFSWIKMIFKDQPKVKPEIVIDDFDDESLPLTERTKLWASFIKRTYPPIDFIFSSEEYGEYFAANLGVKHFSFDLQRKKFPISASIIRQKPFQYWDFIPAVVRPYFVKKICFYGPESTGKSIMAKQMAEKYNTGFVPEVAREFITNNNFTVEDIIKIGREHYQRIVDKNKTANKILFCDTDAITTQIYSYQYLNVIPPVLYDLENKITYDRYFLFDIDVPWIDDGLRDLGHKRKEMFKIFREALEKRGISYTLVTGDWHQRKKIVITIIEKLLQ